MRALMATAIAAGATTSSHVNDSGLWLVNCYLDLSVPDTLRAWTMSSASVAFTGLVLALAMNLAISQVFPMTLVLMGVSGSGKTTVGRILAKSLEYDLADADDLSIDISRSHREIAASIIQMLKLHPEHSGVQSGR